MKRMLIVPAAGRGSRLGYDKPKFLYPLCSKPLIHHVLDLYQEFVDEVIVVVSPDAVELASKELYKSSLLVRLCTQEKPTGMLDAILAATDLIDELEPERIWITWCDQVGIRKETLDKLLELEEFKPSAMIVPVIHKSHPYIHFETDNQNRIVNVFQRREGDIMPEIGVNDMGLFSMSLRSFYKMKTEFSISLELSKSTKERNFLPFIPWLAASETVIPLEGTDISEAIGINTPEEAQEFAARQSFR